MQRDLGTRRAVVIVHYWSRTALGGRDDQGADLLDCGLVRLQRGRSRPGQDPQALDHAVPTLYCYVPCPAASALVRHRGVVLAPAAPDEAVGGAQLDDLHVLAREVLKAAPAP
jgi:hypothetical protein